MPLPDLLETDSKNLNPDIEGCLHVVVHPFFPVFFGDYWGDPELDYGTTEVYVEHVIGELFKLDKALSRYEGSSFLPLGDARNGIQDGRVPITKDKTILERLEKTELFMDQMLYFLLAYETLRQAKKIDELLAQNKPTVLVLPFPRKEYKITHQMFGQYIRGIVGDARNVVSVYSDDFQKQGDLTLPQGALTPPKVDAISRLCHDLDIRERRWFGAYLNHCLYNSRNSFGPSEIVDTVLLDVSISRRSDALEAYFKCAPVQLFYEQLGEQGYQELVREANALLDLRPTFLSLVHALGKSPSEQLKYFEGFPDLLTRLQRIKHLYAFRHRE